MKGIFLGWDRSLLVPQDSAGGDFHERAGRYAERLEELNIVAFTTRRLGLPRERHDGTFHAWGTNSLARLLYATDAYRLCREVSRHARTEFLFCQDPFLAGGVGAWLAATGGPPFGVGLFSAFYSSEEWQHERWYRPLLARAGLEVMALARAVRVQTEREKLELARRGVDETKIHVIPLPYVNPRFDDPREDGLRSRLLGDRFDRIVLFVGRLAAEKDLPLLLDAAKEVGSVLPRCLFCLVGKGPEEERLRRRISEERIENVQLAGFVSADDLPRYYAACDLFALPSRYEGVPVVLTEASLCARPAVITRTPNAEELVVDEETGHIVPIGDAHALATRILQRLADPEGTRRMGLFARERTKARLDPDRLLAAMVRMWEAIARG